MSEWDDARFTSPPRSTLLNSWVKRSGCRATSSAPTACANRATSPILALPSSEYDPYDACYANAAVMSRAGVEIAIMANDTENTRNLPFHAAMAVVDTTSDIEALVRSNARLLGASDDEVIHAIAAIHAARIVHVHCKDIRKEKLAIARQKDLSFLDAVVGDVFAVPGDGAIDFAPILEGLAGKKYSGWLVVEADQDPAKAHPLTHARIGHDCLRPLARRYWKQ